MSHRTGDLLGGRYRLDDRIAVGGMGEVWRATDTVLGRAIAVKTLRDDRAADPQFRQRFQHEARAMAALHHPGIADVYDFGQQPGDGTYLVMARVGGEPLNERIARLGRLTAPDTMSIVAQVARALQAAHEAGIVHRDVKPGNIIVEPDGRAVLVDFGIARSAASPAITGAGEIIGTAHYIAPEQVRKQPATPAIDVYALGAVAYHCLAGHPPFVGDNPVAVAAQHASQQQPPQLPPDVPLPVRALVTTALANDAAARFPSAAAMAGAAERAGRDVEAATPTTLRLSTLPEPPGRQPARTRWRIVTVLMLMLVALSGVATALALTDPFGPSPAPPPATSATPSTVAPTTRAAATTGGHSQRPPTSPATTTSEPAPTTTPPRSTPATTTPPTTRTPTSVPPTTGRTTGPPPTTQGRL